MRQKLVVRTKRKIHSGIRRMRCYNIYQTEDIEHVILAEVLNGHMGSSGEGV